ncbi:MAG: hypothetical protein MRZ26_00695 [Ruminococcus sp.]|nr:hypothetical protein [Ruminococcus sp.]
MTDIDKNEHNICESTTRACPCTFDCPHHGKCCDCVEHHRDHNEGVPGCFFSEEAEATYDRSIEALCRDRGIKLADE